MLPVSLDCLFLTAPSVFSNVYLFCVLCAQCYQCLWIVHSWPPLQFSPTFICPVSCVSNVASVSGLSIFYFPFGFVLPVSLDCPFLTAPSVFSNVYLSCVLCVQCCQFLWLVHSSLSLQFSLTCICPVFCVSYVASFTGLSILRCPFNIL